MSHLSLVVLIALSLVVHASEDVTSSPSYTNVTWWNARAPLLNPRGESGKLSSTALNGWWKKRITGADLDTNRRWRVAGTDLGIPYVLENGSIGYLFGDTFNSAWPEGPPLPNDWRAPVLLRSRSHPASPQGIVWDNAAQGKPSTHITETQLLCI
jgi:hypothetical protein